MPSVVPLMVTEPAVEAVAAEKAVTTPQRLIVDPLPMITVDEMISPCELGTMLKHRLAPIEIIPVPLKIAPGAIT